MLIRKSKLKYLTGDGHGHIPLQCRSAKFKLRNQIALRICETKVENIFAKNQGSRNGGGGV
jgi:hypothetical protein